MHPKIWNQAQLLGRKNNNRLEELLTHETEGKRLEETMKIDRRNYSLRVTNTKPETMKRYRLEEISVTTCPQSIGGNTQRHNQTTWKSSAINRVEVKQVPIENQTGSHESSQSKQQNSWIFLLLKQRLRVFCGSETLKRKCWNFLSKRTNQTGELKIQLRKGE